ncbi:thioredoxin family protein [Candidatus Poribacteria bacterium]|nr:thioredoxin family protein [Candidatus Poribacteria bacterium]
MKSHKFRMFYSPFCAICPVAKEIVRAFADEHEILLEEINIFSPAGQIIANEYKIRSVPSLIIDEIHRIDGIPTKEQIEEYVKQ